MEDLELEENVHDKVDEKLEEVEADGSEENDARSGSVPDPFSLRTTPNSKMSITDEETFIGDGVTIDLTKEVDLDDSVIVIESRLREDAYKVLRILADEKGPLRKFDEIYAYLEAHLYNPNRVQIVVEEFLGMNNTDERSRSPSPTLCLPEDAPPIVEQLSVKGKGVGKNSNTFKPVKIPDKDETASTSSSTTIVSHVAVKRHLNSSQVIEPSPSKRVKVEQDAAETSVSSQSKIENVPQGDPITEDTLHEIVEDSTNKRKNCLSPPRLKITAHDFTFHVPESVPPAEIIAPSNPQSEFPANKPIIHPAKNNLDSSKTSSNGNEPIPKERTPSIEVMREEIVVDATNEVVDIADDLAEIEALAGNLAAMFPDTPLGYIRVRCNDLAGKPAAIERFTEELLIDPKPPDNWEQIYKKPFQLVEDNGANVAAAAPLNNNMKNDSKEKVIPNPTEEPRENKSSNREIDADGPSTSKAYNDDTAPAAASVIDDNSSSSSSHLSADPKPDLDPVVRWELERHGQMISMFPEICPDYLLGLVQSSKANPASSSGSSTGQQPSINEMEALFAAKVEQMFAMRSEERRLLPTRVQWKTKQKAKEWSGNMSVNDMMLLYSDDPAGYFENPERKPESELYKQHVIEGLKNEFRYHSLTEINRAFKKARFLYLPAYKHLKKGENTRKTKRPDLEIKFPSEPCIEFLKEKKFIELEEQIKAEKERRAADREARIEAAKLLGNLQECLCCYSSDCLEEDMISCKGGHLYCRECISRGAAVAIGDGKTVIECLGHCQEEIGWQELQKALTPNVLSKLLQRRQAEEVGAAELDNMVTCPFCPYVTIMENPDDKVLVCRNPECGRDSCRLCQEPNHVPLRCDEVKDGETERKRIEEQLSEAMMRECWKCKVKYFKLEGCNKMTCPRPGCGAKMCYLCKQPVKDYTHFYGQGGAPDKTRTCPLWTDSKKLHEEEVAKAAAKAKEELKKKNIQLKHDPTAGAAMPAGKTK